MDNQPLSEEQMQQFWQDGYLLLEDVVTAKQLADLRVDFELWRQESRQHGEPYGETFDHRPRFDLEPGHCAESPALRRVASPVEISDAYLDVMRTNRAVDAVTQLIGPNLVFNNAKINSKQPQSATKVQFHQDFLFQPHTNDDLIAVLLCMDDMTLENGPLEVAPGSHRGPLYNHWHHGVFTGAVSADVVDAHKPQMVTLEVPAGSACLLHNRTLHGSGPNTSAEARTLFICEYRSGDAQPLQVSHLPSLIEGEILRGEASIRVRCTSYEMLYPEVPSGASFFDQQANDPAPAL